MRIAWTIVCLLGTLCGNAWAVGKSDLVRASLLSNVSVVKPGEAFTVGVLLEMKPGWHTYWANPGDAGLPTRIQWTLPPGYVASDLHFPVPERIEQTGGIVMFGYTDKVLLTATITSPPSSEAGNSMAIPIQAKVKWLCCADECVPGNATVNLQLMSGEKSSPANAELFAQWQARMPVISPTQPSPLVLSDSSVHTEITTTRRITDAKAVIPGAADGMTLIIGTPHATEVGTVIPISAQILKGQTVAARSVPILLTWASPDGSTRLGEQISVPIISGH